MPRNARQNIEGQYFHIMVQGIGKEHVFPDNDSKGYYISCLQAAKEKYHAKVLAFCVMGNHAHVLLSVKNTEELSSYLKVVNTKYASYYNRTNRRVGYVFRGRFNSQLILDEKHLIYCLAYIHNNPVKAKIVQKAEEYGFSSLTNYLIGRGTVDFEEAKKYYDISPENIMAIMQERTDVEWIEHEEEKEDFDKVLKELLKRFGYKRGETIIDIDIAAKITKAMKARCGANVKEMAKVLGVGREKLRKKVAPNTVP